MPEVYNPQLGREQSYPYEHREEERDWHWGMVINTNRCINCNTCSFACKSTWTSGQGEECGHNHDLYGDGEYRDELGVDVLAELPFDRELQNPDSRTGTGENGVADLAETVGDHLESDDAGPVTIPDSALDIRGLPPRIRHEQVGEEFQALDPGEEFYVVNDHDPSPLVEMLAGEFADASPEEAFDTCEVHRRAPDEWVLEVECAT